MPDHFELRLLYVHTLFSNSSDQNSVIKDNFLGKTLWETQMIRTLAGSSSQIFRSNSGWSGIAPDHPASLVLTSLVISGWSGPCPDHPALAPRVYIGLPAGCPNPTSLFLPSPLLCSPNTRTTISSFNQGFVKLLCAFDSPRLGRSGLLRNSSIHAGTSKVFFIQNPLTPIS